MHEATFVVLRCDSHFLGETSTMREVLWLDVPGDEQLAGRVDDVYEMPSHPWETRSYMQRVA